MKNELFAGLRKSLTKKAYRAYCKSLRAENGFNTGTRVFSDKRFGRQGANARWADAEY